MKAFKIVFHNILIKNNNEKPWKLKAIHIRKIPGRMIFKKVIKNVPVFQDSLIDLIELLDKREHDYIDGTKLTAILKKEFGVLQLKY